MLWFVRGFVIVFPLAMLLVFAHPGRDPAG